MKLIASLLLLVPLVAAAQAPTTYSFASLAWDDSVVNVDAKLKAEGFTGCEALAMLRLKCKANETCECFFNGPGIIDGRAQFHDGKLGRVVVTASGFCHQITGII